MKTAFLARECVGVEGRVPGAVIIVEDERITAVGKSGEVPIPSGVAVVDLEEGLLHLRRNMQRSSFAAHP